MSRQVSHDGRGSLIVTFPFNRRLVDLVKSLPSRRWNGERKVWTVPETDVVALVDLVQPEGFKFDAAVERLYAAAGGRRPIRAGAEPRADAAQRALFGAEPDAPASETEFADLGATFASSDYSVSRLNGEVQAALQRAFPESVWLVGEISGFNKSAHKKHVGFTLVERAPSGDTVAQVNAILFADVRREVEDALRAASDPFKLEDEIEIRVRGRVELYEAWGQYRLRVEEIDVRYTLGEAARRREEIVRRLAAEGLLERNASLPFPELPLRVGLVTSLGSDAFNDVLKTLRESGFAFDVVVHGARVQGRSTEPSVLNALDWFRERGGRFDVVLVCRGGGSRTDLQWFDSEALGRAVAGFPLPVVVGIGHEQDLSVLDFVGRRAKTPTAAAQMLVEAVRLALDRVESACGAIVDEAADALRAARRDGDERALRLVRAARAALVLEALELRRRRERTGLAARARLGAAGRDLDRTSRETPRSAVRLLDRGRLALEQAVRQLAQGARRDLAAATRRTTEIGAGLSPRAARLFSLEDERVEARGRRLHLLDPRRVVERGYAILRGPSLRVVTDPAAAPAGTALTVELRAGALRARSEGRADSDPRSER